jgi:hypothetical protein
MNEYLNEMAKIVFASTINFLTPKIKITKKYNL